MKGNMLKELAMRAKNRMMNKSGNSYDARIRVIANDDSEFTERVRKILEDEEDSRNPLKILMDEKKINKLDEFGKERYLLETMDKYLKAKAELEQQSFIG